MPPMKKLEVLLREKAEAIFNSDEREILTVNLVRKRVAEDEGLGDDLAGTDEWKVKSKKIIKDTIVSVSPHPFFFWK